MRCFRRVRWLVALIALTPLYDGGTVHAVCSAIPAPLQQGFRSARGTVDRPFASPGDFVTVRIPGGVSAVTADLVVTLVFKPDLITTTERPRPPLGPMHRIVLYAAPSPPTSCDDGVPTTFVRVNDGSRPAELAVSSNDGGPDRIMFSFPNEYCVDGETGGVAGRCVNDTQCGTGTCGQHLCLGGANEGVSCVDDAACPNGHCVPAPLSGPVAIAITDIHQRPPCDLATKGCNGLNPADEIGCVDRLFANEDPSVEPEREHAVFPFFTALPHPNDYGALVADTADDVQLALDFDGNVLVPIAWNGVLLKTSWITGQDVVLPVARLVRFATSVDAFDGRPVRSIRIPDQPFLGAFTPFGVRLPPIFEAQVDRATRSELVLFGSADEQRSVLRIARRGRVCQGGPNDGHSCVDAECGAAPCGDVHSCQEGDSGKDVCTTDAECCRDGNCPESCRLGLFDFASRILGGVGPAVISRPKFDAAASDPVPFDGFVQTKALQAFVVNEALGHTDVDGNHDSAGSVLVVHDAADGAQQHLTADQPCAAGSARMDGRLVTRVHTPPLSFYAMAAEENVVAFLEPEAQPRAAGRDLNCDGDTVDTVLRIFRRGTKDTPNSDLTSLGGPLAADAAPLVNGRSLAVSRGRVFVRAREVAAAPRTTTDTISASVNTAGEPANFHSWRPAISGNGRFVAFESEATNLAAGDDNEQSDVFVRDLCVENGRRLSGCQTSTELVSTACDSPDTTCDGSSSSAAISDDGRFVAFVTYTKELVGRVLVRDRVAGITIPIHPNIGGPSLVSTAIVSHDDTFVAAFTRELGGADPAVYVYDSAHPPAIPISAPGTCNKDVAISADGRFVAYATRACSIGSNGDSADLYTQIVLFDRECEPSSGSCTELVSANSRGERGNLFSQTPVISRDGSLVAFISHATDLTESYPPGIPQMYLRDRRAGISSGKTTIVRSGVADLWPAFMRGMSSDARFLALSGYTDNSDHLGFSIVDRLTGLPVHVIRPEELNALSDLGMPARSALSSDGRTLVFVGERARVMAGEDSTITDVFVRNVTGHVVDTANAKDVAADLTDNGFVGETVLQVFDTMAASIGPVGPSCPATQVAVADGRAVFLRPEWEGSCRGLTDPETVVGGKRITDLNGNHRDDDQVVHFWHGGTITPLHVAATAVALSPTHIAALVSECAMPGTTVVGCPSGGTDLNHDGDAGDTVVHVSPVADPTHWTNLEQAADRVEIVGQVVAFTTPEAAQGKPLNQDGDLRDDVLQVYDLCGTPGPTSVHNVGEPAQDFVIGESTRSGCDSSGTQLIAFRTREADRCTADDTDTVDAQTCKPHGCSTVAACVLNNDADCCDDVLQVYEMPTGKLRRNPDGPAGYAVTPCIFEGCDPRVPYKVGKHSVTFLTLECDEGSAGYDNCERGGGAALNGDHDADDLILQTLHVGPSGTRHTTLGAVSTALCTEPDSDGHPVSCLVDADCPNGTCRILASRCVVSYGSCTLTTSNGEAPTNPCAQFGPAVSCGVFDTHSGTQCVAVAGTCERDADCSYPVTIGAATAAHCVKTAQELQLLAGPLAAPGGGGEVFTSVGRCANEAKACNSNSDCFNDGACEQQLVVATTNDADHDEVADVYDNCPDVANPDQQDCPDVASCGDGIVTAPGEICDNGRSNLNGDAIASCIDCTALCGPVPRTNCHVPPPAASGKTRIVFHDGEDGALTFRWPAAPGTLPELGDPVHTTNYALCVYDVAEEPRLLLETQVRAGGICSSGACWKPTSARGFRFKNRSVDEGLTNLTLAAKRKGVVTLKALGKGLHVAPAGTTSPAAVLVQLVNSDTNGCWQAQFPPSAP